MTFTSPKDEIYISEELLLERKTGAKVFEKFLLTMLTNIILNDISFDGR